MTVQPQQLAEAVVKAVPQQQYSLNFSASGDDYADDFEELVAEDEANKKPAGSKKAKQTRSKTPKTIIM